MMLSRVDTLCSGRRHGFAIEEQVVAEALGGVPLRPCAQIETASGFRHLFGLRLLLAGGLTLDLLDQLGQDDAKLASLAGQAQLEYPPHPFGIERSLVAAGSGAVQAPRGERLEQPQALLQ
jgi:hypothetical protein